MKDILYIFSNLIINVLYVTAYLIKDILFNILGQILILYCMPFKACVRFMLCLGFGN